MLPPITPAVLDSNPKFKALYANLASSRLNGDASTRLIKQQRAQAEVEKQLLTARKEEAQNQLLQDALRSSASVGADLPPELIEPCHIVSAQLSGDLTSADLEVLADDIGYFMSNIPRVAATISQHLEESGSLISQLASADGSWPDISQLATQASTLQESIASQTTSIALTRARITELADQIHAGYRDIFELSIRILEQTMHGSLARGQKARAEHLAAVAKGMHLKLQILAQTDSMLTDPALNDDLSAYASRLRALEDELDPRVAAASAELQQYDDAGRGMSELARRYAELLRERDAVSDEIKKLESHGTDVY